MSVVLLMVFANVAQGLRELTYNSVIIPEEI